MEHWCVNSLLQGDRVEHWCVTVVRRLSETTLSQCGCAIVSLNGPNVGHSGCKDIEYLMC